MRANITLNFRLDMPGSVTLKADFIVLDQLSVEMILGLRFLSKYKVLFLAIAEKETY